MSSRLRRPLNPILRQGLEFGPTIAFFVIYLAIRDQTFVFAGAERSGFIVATVVFVPILLAAMGALWALTGKLSRIQVFTAFMVIFFGSMTAWFNDARFFKMKTSIVYAALASVLLAGLLIGRNWLQWVMGEMLPMKPEGWARLTRRVIVMFLLMAALNEAIWRTQSDTTWVTIETFAFPVAIFLFFWLQIISLGKYLQFDLDKPDGQGKP